MEGAGTRPLGATASRPVYGAPAGRGSRLGGGRGCTPIRMQELGAATAPLLSPHAECMLSSGACQGCSLAGCNRGTSGDGVARSTPYASEQAQLEPLEEVSEREDESPTAMRMRMQEMSDSMLEYEKAMREQQQQLELEMRNLREANAVLATRLNEASASAT